MTKQQKDQVKSNEELSLEQKKFRDRVRNEENLMTQDKKLGGPNRPSE